MPELIGAAGQLERIFYILPKAAREGGATVEELSLALGVGQDLSLIHISEPTRPTRASRMPSSA